MTPPRECDRELLWKRNLSRSDVSLGGAKLITVEVSSTGEVRIPKIVDTFTKSFAFCGFQG